MMRTPSSRATGSQKAFSAQPGSFSGIEQVVRASKMAARPTSRRLTVGSNHHKYLGPSRRGGFGLGETSRCHSVLRALVSRPVSRFTTGLPEIFFAAGPGDPVGVKGHIVFRHMSGGLGQFAGQCLGVAMIGLVCFALRS